MKLQNIPASYKIALWVVALVAVDQIVKLLVHYNIPLGGQIEVFDWFRLCHIENNGFAFGMQLSSGGSIDWGKIVLSVFRLAMIGLVIYGIRYMIQILTALGKDSGGRDRQHGRQHVLRTAI